MTARRVAAALALAIVLAACQGAAPAPQTPTAKAARYVQIFKTVSAAYEEAMVAAGRAHAQGILSDADLARVRQAGLAVEVALRTSQAALEAYLAGGDDLAREAAVVGALADLQRAVAELLVSRSAPPPPLPAPDGGSGQPVGPGVTP